ncbi:MAG: hypothetical protein H7144_15730 [Burkholderiales bacterium]|nr:hypothetical protein [Phycisphaerae bacterium]
MDPIALAILLFAVGFALIIAEALLPAYGIIGVGGLICVLGGLGVCFWINQWLGGGLLIAMLAASPFVGAWWVKIWPRTAVGKRMVLQTVAGTPKVITIRIGSTGTVVSELRPGGVCEIAGERVPAVSEHEMIRAGTKVRVVGIVDDRAIVREISV